eukprot:SAG11_NODE_1245_length_5402_cov_2.436357_2_plen_319_part_00
MIGNDIPTKVQDSTIQIIPVSQEILPQSNRTLKNARTTQGTFLSQKILFPPTHTVSKSLPVGTSAAVATRGNRVSHTWAFRWISARASMSTVPATTQEYLDFLQGSHGPQAAFARQFDKTVRLMKQQSVPAAYDVIDIAQIWATLEKLEVRVSDQRVSADDSVFGSDAAQKTAWWKDSGLQMVERFVRAYKLHTDPEKISAKELAGKVLSSRSCVEMVQSSTWRQFKTAVQAEELAQAVALLDADTDTSAKVARAIMFIKDSHNLVIAGADTERKEVYRTLLLFEDQVDSAIEDELVSSLVELEFCEPDFASSVRQSL